MASGYNRDDLLIAEFKEAFNEFDKVRIDTFRKTIFIKAKLFIFIFYWEFFFILFI